MAEVVARWKQFIEKQPPDGPLSSVILASWDRSEAAGVERDPPEATFHQVSEDDIRERLRLNADWLAVARPHVEWLTTMYRHVPHVIYLTDRHGIVLHSVGDQEFIQGFGLSPGCDWSEARMGTNGAGTALASGKPVAIVGSEHWVSAFEDCTCTGAPICGLNHEIVGAIDISTRVMDGCPERLPVVAYAAYVIGREVTLAQGSSHEAESALEASTALPRAEDGWVQLVIGAALDTAERKRVEESLRFQLDLTRRITDNATTAIFMMDDKSRCTFMNPAAEQMTGFTFEEVKGGILHDFIHHHHSDGRPYPMSECPIDRALPEHFEVRDYEDIFVRKSGEFFPVLCNARVIYKEGRANGTVIEVRDITKEKSAQAALRRAEERFRASQDASLFGFTILNAVRGDGGDIVDFEWEYVNPAAVAILKRPAADLVGRRLLAVLPNNSQNSDLFRAYVLVVETGQPHDFELRYEGEGIDGWFRNMAVKLDDGVAISFSDMTARRRAEEEVRQRERLLQSVLDNAPAVIFIKDIEGRLLLVNRQFCELADRPADEIVGRLDREVFSGPSLDDIHANDLRVFAEGHTLEFEEVLDLVDGPHTFLSVKVPVEGVGFPGTVLVGMTIDITRRKRAEESLRGADRRKDEFLATLAHELRNPLAPIRNAVQVLKMKGPSEPDLMWSRDVIDRQVGQMARLLDDLLDVSRITRNKLELRKGRVTLAEVIENAVETSRPLIDAGSHQLAIALPSEPVYLDADPMRLAQVFANLLNNAAKYTDPGGHIRLTAEQIGHEVMISVEDNGIGIDRDILPRLFKMFSQATPALERAQGGLGIGLSLVKGLVEMHGGAVTAHSDGPGTGSKFIVRLPVLSAEPPQ